MLLRTKVPLPVGHPSMSRFTCTSAKPVMDICFDHVPINSQLSKAVSGNTGYNYPTAHKMLNSFYRSDLFTSHPNLDTALRSGTKYSAGHPNVDLYVTLMVNLKYSRRQTPPSPPPPPSPSHPLLSHPLRTAM